MLLLVIIKEKIRNPQFRRGKINHRSPQSASGERGISGGHLELDKNNSHADASEEPSYQNKVFVIEVKEIEFVQSSFFV